MGFLEDHLVTSVLLSTNYYYGRIFLPSASTALHRANKEKWQKSMGLLYKWPCCLQKEALKWETAHTLVCRNLAQCGWPQHDIFSPLKIFAGPEP